MCELNDKYLVEILVETPLSIGAGAEKDWAPGVDYVVKDKVLYKLNLNKIINAKVDISSLTNYIANHDEKAIIRLITERRLTECSDFTLKLPAISQNNIKVHLKNQLTGAPIISGSSIKGALRSILLNSFVHYNPPKNVKDLVEANYFGSSKIGDEFMRFIKISDAEFDRTDLVNTKIFNLDGSGNEWSGGWKHGASNTTAYFNNVGFNTIYECIMPGHKSYAQIMFSLQAFELYANMRGSHILHNQKATILRGGINELFAIINAHTKNYLLKEKKFFSEYDQAEHTDKIIASIDELIAKIDSSGNSFCIMKMSAGSGFHSITGDWQYNDYVNIGNDTKGKHKYKSRKIAIRDNTHFDLMGFVRLTAVSNEDKLHYHNELRNDLQNYTAEQNERILKIKREGEERARKEQERILLQEEYNDVILSLNKAFENENWKSVVELVEMANSIYPNRADQLQRFKKKAETEIELNALRESRQEAESRLQELQMQQYKVPLSERISNAIKLPTLFGNIKTWMKNNEKSSLSSDELEGVYAKVVEIYSSLKQRDKDNLKKNIKLWNGLIDLLGESCVKELIDRL